MIGQLNERAARDDLHLGARPGGLRPACRRADQPLPARIGADRRRQHACDRRKRAVEAELAQHREAIDGVVRNRTDGRHQAERDRQIIVAAFLRQIGRRHVDGDAARRQRKARGDQCGAHPLARFRHRLVGQADDIERRQSGRDLYLHVDGTRLDAFERHGGYALHHAVPLPGLTTIAGFPQVARTFAEQTELR